MSDRRRRAAEATRGPRVDRPIEWPHAEQVYLTLDFECDFGTALETNSYQAVSKIDRLVSLLESTSTPLTCFVQTELTEVRPEAVEALRESDVPVTFHPHSHTHRPRDQTSIREEIETSTDRYTEFFGRRPTGYRFPNGNVRDEDYELLASAGYQFDSSVFPTWRPGHFNNTDASTSPTYLERFDLFELPFSVLSPYAPLPIGLSYARIFGRPYVNRLLESPPRSVVFNIHMHDLYTPPSSARLPSVYRLLYSRNDHGFSLLRRFIEKFDQAGYSFGTLDGVHEQLRDGHVSTPENQTPARD
ncbi:polysaccharide deacetylase family protein [Halogeometricum sp. S1BR25-6]|uniref:Polysaccharide deacetylase family protein n=1 Tax=Halogeometricum salsisoli TaxID=2950536 RepID=A0ABU2GHG1_9EURY|nr:polysaccharide deacetylase family protein [Halogeometricum sp. S1BR25-6]MDS0300272.1 polysaccharide deacetylase family protein [Halogeometricum sp. S1BR25-6]